MLVLVAGLGVTVGTAPQAQAATFAEMVLQEAAVHQGKPYLWAATGPDSFDCSGFTRYVYGQLGIALPRTSGEQYAALPNVAQADKQPGDLVFTFDDAGVVYHVGIYAGANQMWAAPKTGDYVRLQTIWTSSYKVARPVPAAIQQHWVSLGSQGGPLGFPTTGELRTPDGIGAYTHYRGGSIYWTPGTHAREVRGAIRGTWERLGWEKSALGYPTTDELGTPDGRGRFNHFQSGSVYWTPSTGAREVRGAIRSTWERLGWERSALGYPLSDETATADGVGRFNRFQSGSIYWTPATGPVAVDGAIHQAWLVEGAEAGRLGYPTRESYAVPGGQAADFQSGTISWDRGTGQTTISPP